MKRVVFLLLVICNLSVMAQERQSIFESLRPYVEQYLGNDIANKIWGERGSNLSLPKLPTLDDNATSTDVYKNKKTKPNNYTADQMAQYNSNYVNELIEVTRETRANKNDLVRWIGTLSQGATREGVYRAMVLDQYYSRLENYNQSISTANIKFAQKAFNRYTGKEVKEKSLQKINHYSLKRIYTERCLDIMDALLSQSEESLYDWYAVYSAEIAKEYKVFESKMRQSTNADKHKAWAKKAPFQFIKSEVIIKTHKLINALQKRN